MNNGFIFEMVERLIKDARFHLEVRDYTAAKVIAETALKDLGRISETTLKEEKYLQSLEAQLEGIIDQCETLG